MMEAVGYEANLEWRTVSGLDSLVCSSARARGRTGDEPPVGGKADSQRDLVPSSSGC